MKGWSGIRLKCLHSVCFIAGEMQAVDVLSVWPLHICTWDQHWRMPEIELLIGDIRTAASML